MKAPTLTSLNKETKGFGTAPVFFTAISTILGAILFLRFGFAVGTLGFMGTLLIVILGHAVTIPTALAISEIATNFKVEGGGEYFIMSRSFGLNIGATIGIALFLSQAVSVAFYVIAFTEAFDPLFKIYADRFGVELPRQVVSIPAMGLLALLMLTKGANMGVKALYVVVGILFFSLVMFFIGTTTFAETFDSSDILGDFRNSNDFFFVFAVIFPAFTGMTAGVGLSGDLEKPRRSIPIGTTAATFSGLLVYIFILYKLAVSASPDDLVNDQLIMAKIAYFGAWIVPLGLAASTISSALGSIMVAPRTLQALSLDQAFPSKKVNYFFAKGVPGTHEPRNASMMVIVIAFIFIALGDVNAVAKIISMFFMVTYGSLNLISFLNHFGADPSYRPSFKSRWYFSLIGFILSVWLMFKMNTPYALGSIIIMVLIYLYMNHYHKDRKGLETLFKGALFQLNRNLQVFLQKSKKSLSDDSWRPSAICVSKDSLRREEAFELLAWISHNHGFGTYIHLIEGYFSKATNEKSKEILEELIRKSEKRKSNVYIDTIISPSYTSAIAQIIQLPGISGMENNMVIFEFFKDNPDNLTQIIDNFNLVRAGNYDVCILGSSSRRMIYENGIHVWISSTDAENANLMILLSYIIIEHPDWRKSEIKIFSLAKESEKQQVEANLIQLIDSGRLPISPSNIQIIQRNENENRKKLIAKKSFNAGLTIIGFHAEQINHDGEELFKGYDDLFNVLFVCANDNKTIK
ncbi:MAG: amino acid permease [Bacteroidales bacterium]|nr:amino acid permease [Bacteroidales bacterium]